MKRSASARTAGSFLERVIGSLDHAVRHHLGEVVPPPAVLWTNTDGHPQHEEIASLYRSQHANDRRDG